MERGTMQIVLAIILVLTVLLVFYILPLLTLPVLAPGNIVTLDRTIVYAGQQITININPTTSFSKTIQIRNSAHTQIATLNANCAGQNPCAQQKIIFYTVPAGYTPGIYYIAVYDNQAAAYEEELFNVVPTNSPLAATLVLNYIGDNPESTNQIINPLAGTNANIKIRSTLTLNDYVNCHGTSLTCAQINNLDQTEAQMRTSCQSQTGCSDSGNCQGAFACSSVTDQTSCQNLETGGFGCNYNAGSSSCVGSGTCSQVSDSFFCSQVPGCSWIQSGGSCGPKKCQDITDFTTCGLSSVFAECTDGWNEGTGTCGPVGDFYGISSCSDILNSGGCAFASFMGCSWTGSVCVGPSCSQAPDQSLCNPTVCAWTPSGPGSCTGTATCANTGTTESNCNSLASIGMSCSWQTTPWSCTGSGTCSPAGFNTCNTMTSGGLCTGWNTNCQGIASSCASKTQQSTCGTTQSATQLGCYWDTVSINCNNLQVNAYLCDPSIPTCSETTNTYNQQLTLISQNSNQCTYQYTGTNYFPFFKQPGNWNALIKSGILSNQLTFSYTTLAAYSYQSAIDFGELTLNSWNTNKPGTPVDLVNQGNVPLNLNWQSSGFPCIDCGGFWNTFYQDENTFQVDDDPNFNEATETGQQPVYITDYSTNIFPSTLQPCVSASCNDAVGERVSTNFALKVSNLEPGTYRGPITITTT